MRRGSLIRIHSSLYILLVAAFLGQFCLCLRYMHKTRLSRR